MPNYISIKNEYYEIIIPEELKSYGEEVISYSTARLKEYLRFFDEDTYDFPIKGTYVITREDFIRLIKEITFPNSTTLPSWTNWALGSFFGKEIQILLDKENPYDRFYSLAHETFHLMFNKFVYERNNWDRITWLDESLAGNFDGTTANLIKYNVFPKIISKYLNTPKLPLMSELELKGNVRTPDYKAYELFKIVGRYLIETKTPKELLAYINDIEAITSDGHRILKKSLDYFSKKYPPQAKTLKLS